MSLASNPTPAPGAEEALRESEQRWRETAQFNKRLVREVEHRVRNDLAGLLSLVSLMRQKESTVDEFADAIEGRLIAMTHVHQLLAETGWSPVDLQTLVRSLLAAVERLGCHSIPTELAGPPVLVSPRQALPLSMILLEWFTNSCKYGAHSVATGRVRVSWDHPADRPDLIRLRWKESGGPPLRCTPAPSIGTELVNSFASLELRGKCRLGYPETGADHVLEFPRD